MPRPAKVPDIWSQVDLYTVGPKAGQPTKTDIFSAVAEALEGHVPGKFFPTTANGFNRWCRDMSESVNWLHEARDDRAISAHIVETDATGKHSGSKAHFGGTGTTGPSLLLEENASGDTLDVRADNNVAGRFTTTVSSNTTVESLTVRNESHGNIGYMASVQATNPGGTQSSGGLRARCSSNLVFSGFDYVSAIRGENRNGTAGVFRSAGPSFYDAVKIIQEANEGVALRAGFSAQESVGYGVTAIEAEGGDGLTSGGGINAGRAIFAQGGYGHDGATDTDGGMGIWAVGGGADTPNRGGIGALINPGTTAVSGLHVEAFLSNYTADLAYFEIADGIGTGLQIDVDAGIGLLVNAHERSGIEIYQTNGGSGVRPALRLAPQIAPFTSDEGHIWIEDHPAGGTNDLRVDTGNTFDVARYNDWCRAVGESLGSVPISTTQTSVVTASFSSQSYPSEASDVFIEYTCEADLQGTGPSESILEITIIDVTDGSSTIDVRYEYLFRNANAFGNRNIHVKVPYTLPAAGARTFRVELQRFGSGVDFDVSDHVLEVRPQ